MANPFSDSVLLDARAKLSTDTQKMFEGRSPIEGALSMFLQSTKRTFSALQLERIRKSTQQPTRIEYLKNKAFAVYTTLTCDPSSQQSGSSIYTPTWYNRNASFYIDASQVMNNDFSLAEIMANELFNMEKSLFFMDEGNANSVNHFLLAYLAANKTQVNALPQSGYPNVWDPTPNFRVKVLKASEGRFYNLMNADMMLNKYLPTDLLELCNSYWVADEAYYAAQGPNNATNTAFQFLGAKPFISATLTPETGYKSKHYIIKNGGVGLASWTRNDKLTAEFANNIDGNKFFTTYQSVLFPELWLDLMIEKTCEDTTNDGGAPQTPVIKYTYNLNFAAMKQGLSVTDESPIFEYGILSA